MRIETKYREGLKHLMKKVPLDDINVVMLSESVKSNRQTFYYHFRDIGDVIEAIFLKEKVSPNNKPHDFDSLIKPLIAYINANRSFLLNISNSYLNDKIEQFFYSYFYQKTIAYLKAYKNEQVLNYQNYIARYIASIFSKEMAYWLNNSNKEKANHLIKRLTPIWNYFVDQYPVNGKKL